MIDVAHLPNDFAIGCYVPKCQWTDNQPPDGYTAFVLDLKNRVDNAINEAVELLSDCLYGFDAVTVVPSHHHGNMTDIRRVAIELAKGSNGTMLEATDCLHRATPITKLSAGGGDRCVQTHLDSIQLKNPDCLAQRRVLLLDDVRCTGNSLKACSQLLKQAMPRSIHPLVFAQSWHEQMEDPDMTMAYIAQNIHTEYQAQRALLDMEEEREHDAINTLYQFADG